MVAAVSARDGTFVTAHRTYLDHDGHKAPVPSAKKLMTPVAPGALRGAAIQLFPAAATLALTEGIETALAVHRLSGWPVWSCVSASGLEQVDVPDTVTTLYVCADHDRAGLHSAYALARRQASRRTVYVLVPPCPGEDWQDVLQREGV
jgi:putative DNA primase/helicase